MNVRNVQLDFGWSRNPPIYGVFDHIQPNAVVSGEAEFFLLFCKLLAAKSMFASEETEHSPVFPIHLFGGYLNVRSSQFGVLKLLL